MKYLLVGINAKYIHSNLALYSLRAYARKYAGVDVSISEYTINMQVEEIVRDIYEQSPDFIAMSVYIWNVEIIKKVVRDLKAIMPAVTIFLGGPEVSFESKEFLEANHMVDCIMIGEGEATFTELIKTIDATTTSTDIIDSIDATVTSTDIIDSIDTTVTSTDITSFSMINSIALRDAYAGIRGLCYRDNQDNIITTPAREVLDLSTVPFAYEDLSDFENRIIYYETSRGCPYGCAYCLSSVEKKLRFRDMSLVKEELQFFLDNKVKQVKFVDRTFNADHRRSLELLEFIKTNDNGITNFHFEIAGDILTNEEIDILNSLREGLVQLEIGVQSTNAKTLDAINRHTDMNKLKANVSRLLKPNNIHIHLDLIAGLPYDDAESFANSFNEVYGMKGHELQLGFLKMLKGAPISKEGVRYSAYPPYEVLATDYLSYNDICELKKIEDVLEIYHNSCQFVRSEEYLLTFHKSPYEMYKGLAKYNSGIQSKRAVRYENILAYAVSLNCENNEVESISATEAMDSKQAEASKAEATDSMKAGVSTTVDIEYLRRLLTLDYYAREKAKARPVFATDISMYKEDLKNINKEFQSRNVHIEPMWNSNGFYIFDYDSKSAITGNAAVIIWNQ